MSDNGDGAGVDETVDEHHQVRDMVEPVTRPRMLEASLKWERFYRYPDQDRYVEWQLPGSDDGGEKDRRAGDRRSRRRRRLDDPDSDDDDDEWSRPGDEALRAMLVSDPTADEDGEEDHPRNRFLSFLCNPRVETRVLWLNRTFFVMCEGPDSYTEDDEGTLQWWLTEQNLHAIFRFSARTADGKLYCFICNSMGLRRGEDGDGWSCDLLRLFAYSARVRTLEFELVWQPLLEAIVSRSPPPCGRTIDCRTLWLNEAEARTLAFQTHRDTELVLNVGHWLKQMPSSTDTFVPILVDSIRTSRCPKRLVLDDTGVASFRRDDLALVADALRATTGVEAITIRLMKEWRGDWGSSDLLLEAIGGNNGIRSLVVQLSEEIDAERMVDNWTRILASRTIETVDATRVAAAGRYTDEERRECARRVASLVRSNRVVTQIRYDWTTHDRQIMERDVVPLLDLNRFRPVVEAVIAEAGRERALALVAGSERFRGSPWLVFYTVKTCKDIFSPPPLPLPSSQATDSLLHP